MIPCCVTFELEFSVCLGQREQSALRRAQLESLQIVTATMDESKRYRNRENQQGKIMKISRKNDKMKQNSIPEVKSLSSIGRYRKRANPLREATRCKQ